MKVISNTLLLLSIFFILSCSTSDKIDCQSTNWYEIGRQKGLQGNSKTDTLAKLNNCAEDGSSQSQLEHGSNAGLAYFCSRENALDFGKSGSSYNNVCPEVLKSNFLKFYEKGKKIYEIEKLVLTINEKISELTNKSSQTTNPLKIKNYRTQLNQLKKEKLNKMNQIDNFLEL